MVDWAEVYSGPGASILIVGGSVQIHHKVIHGSGTGQAVGKGALDEMRDTSQVR